MSSRSLPNPGNRLVFYLLPFTVIALLAAAASAQAARDTPKEQKGLSREVYHQLALLPHLTVFDNLQYQVNGNNVTLAGETSQPINKSDAESAVKSIEGVGNVTNNIKVLPLSPMDNQTRIAEFHAIYSFPSLEKYAQFATQTIHIIVDNGHVTLEGLVDSQADKDAAGLRANSVPNVFSVTNNLQVGDRPAPPR
jgi:hyperosmotically inducible periplasmic protein